MKRVYAFNNEQEFDDAKYAGHKIRSTSRGRKRGSIGFIEDKIFAKITSLVSGSDDKQAKGSQVVYNKTSRAYEVPSPTLWIFDSDNLSNDYTTTDIYSNTALEVDEIVEIIQIPESTNEESINLARKNGGGTGIYKLKITASTSISTYTATIINNRTDQTTIKTGVTLKALDHDAGTIPTGQILDCTYDSDNEWYEAMNYPVFLSS